MSSSPATGDRSESRGRDILASSGRGGAGNIRSVSRDALKAAGHDDDGSNTRGREFDVSPKVISSGRGGAGNIRSNSASRTRSPSAGPTKAERELIDKHIHIDETAVHSSGRGGLGNITSSRSRSRDPNPSAAGVVTDGTIKPPIHTTGRGGAGNMTREGGDAAALAKVEEAEIAKHAEILENTHIHSTGRGGLANMTDAPTPPDAKVAHHDPAHSVAHSTGRGGAGNIHLDNPDDPEQRGRGHHKGPIGEVIDAIRSISRSKSKVSAQKNADAAPPTGPGGNVALNAK